MIGTAQQLEKPFWIIISDEGPSSFPYRHETYDSAYVESVRLSKVKPGLKFNIFKYLGHIIAEKPKVKHNTYYEAPPNLDRNYWYSYPAPKFVVNKDEIPF